MRSNQSPAWNWQQGTPPPPRPKRSRRRQVEPEEPREPKQPFGAMEFPPEEHTFRDASRLKLLKWTAPVALVIGLIGLWLTALFLWTMFARSQAEGNNLVSALHQYERQQAVTGHFPEPWLAKYNLGTALLMDGDLSRGVEELSAALDGVPKAIQSEQGAIQPFSYECMVRMNLGAGIEMQGDAVSVSSAGEGPGGEATALYERALELVAPCEVPPPPSPDEDAGGDGFEDSPEERNEAAAEEFRQDGNEAGDRLREKLGQEPDEVEEDTQDQDEQREDSESDVSEGTDPFEGESEEERERREDLQERNREQAERQRENEESRNRNPSSGGW